MRYQQSPNIHKLNMVSIYVIEIVAKLAYNDINNAHTLGFLFLSASDHLLIFLSLKTLLCKDHTYCTVEDNSHMSFETLFFSLKSSYVPRKLREI